MYSISITSPSATPFMTRARAIFTPKRAPRITHLVVAKAPILLVWTEGVRSHDDGASLGTQVGFLKQGRRVRPNHAADRHEEARRTCQPSELPLSYAETAPYPNVAPDPSMYWPNVRMMPFGPAPYLKMLTVPKIGVRFATAPPQLGSSGGRTKDEADNHANRCVESQSQLSATLAWERIAQGKYVLPPIMAPILTG